MQDADGVDDSTYIGKATFKRNQFAHVSNISRESELTAYIKSLQRNNEEMEKMAADLDRMIKEKKEALRESKIFICLPATDMTILTPKHYTNYKILTDWGPNCHAAPL